MNSILINEHRHIELAYTDKDKSKTLLCSQWLITKNPFLIELLILILIMFKLGFAIMLICRVLCMCDMKREIGRNRTKKIMITHVAYFSQMSTFLDEF